MHSVKKTRSDEMRRKKSMNRDQKLAAVNLNQMFRDLNQ